MIVKNIGIPKRILIIQIKQVGDVLLTTPVIKALRDEFPSAEIDFLVNKNSSQILLNNHNLNKILVYDDRNALMNIINVRNRKYDWVLDFLGNPRSAILAFLSGARVKAGFAHNWRAILYNVKVKPQKGPRYVVDFKLDILRYMGISCPNKGLELYLSDEERRKIKDYLKSINISENDFIVSLSPTSRRPARRWKPEYYAKLGEMLMDRFGAKLFLLWGPGEEYQIEEVLKHTSKKFHVIPKFTLRELAAFIEVTKFMVANCNGPKHISEALKIPNIVIYGPTEPSSWSLVATWSKWIRAEGIDCVECGLQICNRDMRCMNQLLPDKVMEFFENNFSEIAEAYKIR
ncbi:MAG: glycosyltransferase family 9 protein [bacterium]